MITDSLLNFVPIGAPLSLVVGAGLSVPSTNLIDLSGSGVGLAANDVIGNTLLFGQDAGIGGKKAQVDISVGTAFASGGACTLNVAFQGAPDTGAAGGYLPGTWQTFVETGALTVAQLTAGAILGRFDFPPQFPNTQAELPRFLRLLFQTASGLTFTAGTIAFAIVTMVRDDQANKFAAGNYVVA